MLISVVFVALCIIGTSAATTTNVSFCDAQLGTLDPTNDTHVFLINVTSPSPNTSVVVVVLAEPGNETSWVSFSVDVTGSATGPLLPKNTGDEFIQIVLADFSVPPGTPSQLLTVTVFRTTTTAPPPPTVDFILYSYDTNGACRIPLFNDVPMRAFLFPEQQQHANLTFRLLDVQAYPSINVTVVASPTLNMSVCVADSAPPECGYGDLVVPDVNGRELGLVVSPAPPTILASVLEVTVVFRASETPAPSPTATLPPSPPPPPPASSGITGGGIFLILFFVVGGIYFVGGTAMKCLAGTRECPEALPHPTFWCHTAPGYVQDGCGCCLATLCCQRGVMMAHKYESVSTPTAVQYEDAEHVNA